MDAWRRVSTWLELDAESAENAALFAEITSQGMESAGSIARLRKRFSAERIAAATELLAARARAVGKLEFGWPMVADREGVEMASSTVCARWKATRVRRARESEQRVLDLFTSVGADLHALVEVCGEESVLGVELDPLRAWMACSPAPFAFATVSALSARGG